MNMYGLLLAKKLSGGGGGSSTLVPKTITANGTYNPADDNADGYSSVTANVPNTYTVADEGKVVDSGALVGQTAKNIDANGLYDTTLNNSVSVDVPNSYTVADEGKVVSDGALVAQTAYPSTIVANGTYDTTLNNSVTVDVPPVGVVVEKDVNFYDYDGTLLYSYTAQEFLALSEMPANPTHSGLTAQGWNWTLADAQTFVTTYGCLDIGALFYPRNQIQLTLDIPKDNFTIYLDMGDSRYTGGLTAGIDWGDGVISSDVTANTNIPHTYTNKGVYNIVITGFSLRYAIGKPKCCICVSDGTNLSSLSSLQPYIDCIIAVNGDVVLNGGYLFAECRRLKSVSSSAAYYLGNTLQNCINLPFITIQNGWIHFSLSGCYALEHLSIPRSTTFNNCNYNRALKRVIITYNTTISDNMFTGCYSLEKVILPNTVTSIGAYAFQNCCSLHEITIPSSVTSIGVSAFIGCTGLQTITINAAEGTITGAPWGATNATVVWTG